MARGLIIFGFGYCANNLLQNSNDWDVNILVVTRSHEKISFLRKRGIEVCHWSDKDYVKEWLKKTDTILVSVPPVGNTDPVIESFVNSNNWQSIR